MVPPPAQKRMAMMKKIALQVSWVYFGTGRFLGWRRLSYIAQGSRFEYDEA